MAGLPPGTEVVDDVTGEVVGTPPGELVVAGSLSVQPVAISTSRRRGEMARIGGQPTGG